MEYDKINSLLRNESENLSKFITRQYVKVNSLSNMYNENKSIRFKTPTLRCYGPMLRTYVIMQMLMF